MGGRSDDLPAVELLAGTTGEDCPTTCPSIPSGADRDAFVDRLNELPGCEYDHSRPLDYNWRRIRSAVYLVLEMDSSNEREERYANPFGWPERTSGRPRRRWYVSDFPQRLEASRVRLDLLRQPDPWAADFIVVTHGAPEGPPRADRVALVRQGTPERRTLRVLLICPGCRSSRRRLYLTASGVQCRRCLRLRYERK